MRNAFINYGTDCNDYLVKVMENKLTLTREGKRIKAIVDNAERIYIEHENSKHIDKAMSLERLAELKNNAIPVVDYKRVYQCVDRNERKARRHDKKTSNVL
jgi:hypothetical protein